MSTRLQVVLNEAEIAAFRLAADADGLNLSEWVRRALRDCAGRAGAGDPDARIALIRAAAGHSFPAPDIEQMLAEVESGYAPGA